jgi:cytochrome c5
MKKTIVLLMLCISTIFLSNCARKTSESIAAKQKAKLDARVAEIKKNYTDAQIAEGNVVFQNKCAKCHDLPDPKAHSLKKWDKVLPDMISKAELSDEQSGKVKAWVYTHI